MSKNKEKIELKVHKAKTPRMTSLEETIQLARLQQAVTASALYERKHDQKALKVVTVAAYILFVSMAAITLSFYYVFIWDPSTKPMPPRNTGNCENKVVIPETLAIRLANTTEITAENFFKNIFRSYQAIQNRKEKSNPTISEEKQQVLELSSSPSSSLSLLSSSVSSSPTQTVEHEIGNESTTLPSSFSSSTSMIQQQQQDDDEDPEGDVDYEASGIKQINWNDTTIQLDGDNIKNNKLL